MANIVEIFLEIIINKDLKFNLLITLNNKT
jgi:hypothetical protein